MSSKDLFIQFYERIYDKICGCYVGCFSTLKHLNASKLTDFRRKVKIKFIDGFLVPADTFDNVKGSFPISFQIWKTNIKQDFPDSVLVDVFNEKNEVIKLNKICNTYDKYDLINDWYENNNTSKEKLIGGIMKIGNDFSSSNSLYLYFKERCEYTNHNNNITQSNLIKSIIYLSTRTSIPATWLNDRDQFTAPFEKKQTVFEEAQGKHYLYEDDQDFINNCIVYAIFTKNYTDWNLFDNIELKIPGADRDLEVWYLLKKELDKKRLTKEAQDVYDSALAICRFYHDNKCGKNITNDIKYSSICSYKVDAGWNDILNRIKGQKANKNGKLERCTKCEAYPDAETLFTKLRDDLKYLAGEIEKGVYKYGFLRC